jgi:selenide,water dikinase
MVEEIKLTQYSKGGGCGCKIAPSVLQQIVQTQNKDVFQNLLVGNESSDDAAVYRLDNETAVISTTDFFMPIVDDAFDFGRIAAANSISDIYAMGGTPMMAIAILGWPVSKLPAEEAQKVLEGARAICREAGIPIAGGHTIDSSDPIFGLAVTGTVALKNLKKNNTAKAGDLLFLTKRIGVGLLATAIKRGVLQPDHYSPLLRQMTTLNSIGKVLGELGSVHAMTDVTGFGLLGHSIEMAEGSGLSAEISYSALQRLDGVEEYIKLRTVPGATARNWSSYSNKVQFDKEINVEEARELLPDPQTNGGLLIAISAKGVEELKTLFTGNNLSAFLKPIGKLIEKSEKVIYVKE